MKILKTIMLTATLLVVVPFFSLAQESSVTLDFENADSSLEVVKKYVNALQSGDMNGMNNQLSNDAMLYNLGGAPDSLNVAQHREYYTNSTSQFTHNISRDLYLPVKVTDNWNEGEWVLTWGLNTVTEKATNKTIEIPFHIAFLIKDGKINQAYYYYDMLNILEKRGFTITAPEN